MDDPQSDPVETPEPASGPAGDMEPEQPTAAEEAAQDVVDEYKAEIGRVEAEELEGELKELYELVSKKIRMTIANQRFSPELLRPLLLQIIETVQEFSNGKAHKLDGSIKRSMALSIAKYIVKDLHNNNQMNDELYEYLMISLEIAGPALMDGLKALYSKLVSVGQDISENGCKGCASRNCCLL